MKSFVIVLLIITLFSFILTPVSIEVSPTDRTASILKLNVCHDGNGFMTGSTDFPYLLHNEIVLPAPLEMCSAEISPQLFIDLLVYFEEEKPPRA